MADPITRFIADLNTALVTVKVGAKDEAEEYKIPKNFLCSASPWFKAALNEDRFKEGRELLITMPEDTPKAFEAFVYFATHTNLAFATTNDIDGTGRQLILCCSAWTFAEKYLVPAMQNCAMLRLCELLGHKIEVDDEDRKVFLSESVLAACWQVSTETSPVRNLIADYIVHVLNNGGSLNIEDHMSGLKGLITALHASEACLHQAEKGKFPRFAKPKSWSELLHVEEPGEINYDQVYESFWTDFAVPCEDCGYAASATEMHYRCAHCRKSGCTIHNVDMRVRLCNWCISGYDGND